jgi:hypothetical protein
MLSLILSLGTTESKLHSQAVLPLGKKPRVSDEQEAWWAPEPAWTLWSTGRDLAPVRTVFVFALVNKFFLLSQKVTKINVKQTGRQTSPYLTA